MMKTNAKRKNSAIKKLVPAAGMLALSTSMLATSTYAWFTMNKDVTVTGLQTKAVAEEGIVIAAYTGADHTTAPADSAYTNTAAATTHSPVLELKPTFTANATGWYHNFSKSATNGQVYSDAGYEDVSNIGENTYYLMDKFSIKGLGGNQTVYVKDINVTNGGTQDYDASLRVLIVSGNNVLFFDKAGTRTGTFTTGTGGDISTALSYDLTTENTAGAEILTADRDGEDVYVYMYYDGEDAACKSSNIPSDAFAATTITVTFTTEAPSGGAGG